MEAGKRYARTGDGGARADMTGEWADTLQTLVNVAVAFDLTDLDIRQAMDECLERNRRKGRL